MTREEFIAKAAEAIAKPRIASLSLPYRYHEELLSVIRQETIEQATAALDAVGAWEAFEAAEHAEAVLTGAFRVLGQEPREGEALTSLRRALATAKGR